MKNMESIFDSNKAVTLIALVITIIVLLILAGISIAMLTGENGILTKAATAKDMTDKEGLLEKVKIEVATSIGNNGKIDENQLANNLKNVDEIKTQVGNSVSLPEEFTTNDEKYIVSIDENGKVTVEENYITTPQSYFRVGTELGINNVFSTIELIYGEGYYYKKEITNPLTTYVVSPIFDNQEITMLGHFNSEIVEKIIVKKGFTTICPNAFRDSIELKEVVLPNTITEIRYSAFENCTSLEKINIPNSVSQISSQMFYGCTNLKNVTIPNSVEIIDAHAFSGCTSLKKLYIPNSVKQIDSFNFTNCKDLTITIQAGSTLTMEDFTKTSLTEEQVIFE